MAEIDDLLRDALGKAGTPGDSTGVADAIRSRVESGDPGFPAAATAPGWGGVLGPLLGWMPWLAGVLAVGAIGASLGFFGILPTPFSPAPLGASAAVAVPLSTDGLDCPAGTAITVIPADSEVLAVERDESGGYLALRDPRNTAATVWVVRSAVEPKAGQPSLDTLPIGGCPVQAVETIAPVEPTPEPQPTETDAPAPPPPAADTIAPSITQWWAAPAEICADPQSGWATVSTVSALAADNVGVAGVRATWSGGGPVELSLSGGTWSFAYDPPSGTNGNVAITLVARDAAGNQSAPRVVNVQVWSVGNCPI